MRYLGASELHASYANDCSLGYGECAALATCILLLPLKSIGVMRSRVTKTGFSRNCPAVNESRRARLTVSIPPHCGPSSPKDTERDTRYTRARRHIHAHVTCTFTCNYPAFYLSTCCVCGNRCRFNVISEDFCLTVARTLLLPSCAARSFLLLSFSLSFWT